MYSSSQSTRTKLTIPYSTAAWWAARLPLAVSPCGDTTNCLLHVASTTPDPQFVTLPAYAGAHFTYPQRDGQAEWIYSETVAKLITDSS